MSRLAILAVLLGLGVGLPQVYGMLNPKAYATAMRQFPRSVPWGVALMMLGTVWFVWNVSQESIADFASYKNLLMMFFVAVGIGSCFFVRDFLAVRGLAVVILLLAKLMVDLGRPMLGETDWVLVIQFWAYALVFAGMWLTISPWRLRDAIEWTTANEPRIKTVCGIRLAFGLLIVVLGFAKF